MKLQEAAVERVPLSRSAHLSMIQPSDHEFKLYKLKIADFAKLLGLNGDSIYTEIPKITKNLTQKGLEIR